MVWRIGRGLKNRVWLAEVEVSLLSGRKCEVIPWVWPEISLFSFIPKESLEGMVLKNQQS